MRRACRMGQLVRTRECSVVWEVRSASCQGKARVHLPSARDVRCGKWRVGGLPARVDAPVGVGVDGEVREVSLHGEEPGCVEAHVEERVSVVAQDVGVWVGILAPRGD